MYKAADELCFIGGIKLVFARIYLLLLYRGELTLIKLHQGDVFKAEDCSCLFCSYVDV